MDKQFIFRLWKVFHNLIIKDLRHFLALFVGQKSQLIIYNIKNKSVVSTNKHNRPTKERPKENLDYDLDSAAL